MGNGKFTQCEGGSLVKSQRVALNAYACKPPHLAWSHYKSMLEAQ
jgi:uncharacterized membrane protein